MGYKCLSGRQAEIMAALGRGLVPRGGPYFSLGARDIEDKWLARTDHLISRMPFLSRLGLKIMLHLLEYGWPILFIKRLISIRSLDEADLELLLHAVEKSGVSGAAFMAFIKVLIFPAFYGVEEARQAIGYQARFSVPHEFERLKE